MLYYVMRFIVALLLTFSMEKKPFLVAGLQYIVPPYPTTNRTNLCQRMGSLLNGTLTAASVLQGLRLRVAITQGVPSFSMMIANSTGMPYGGYMYNVLQQVAARTGATFSYTLVPPYPGPPMDYKIWMKRIVRYSDFLGDVAYSDTVSVTSYLAPSPSPHPTPVPRWTDGPVASASSVASWINPSSWSPPPASTTVRLFLMILCWVRL